MNKSSLSYWRDDFDRRAEAAAGLSYVTVQRRLSHVDQLCEYYIHEGGIIEVFGLGATSSRVRGLDGGTLLETMRIDNDVALLVLCDDA